MKPFSEALRRHTAVDKGVEIDVAKIVAPFGSDNEILNPSFACGVTDRSRVGENVLQRFCSVA